MFSINALKSTPGFLLRSFSTTNSVFAGNKVAVVLSGSGVYDGTELHEAAACLAAITRNGFEPVMCAPDADQAHVVDHTSGNEMTDHKRNVLKVNLKYYFRFFVLNALFGNGN